MESGLLGRVGALRQLQVDDTITTPEGGEKELLRLFAHIPLAMPITTPNKAVVGILDI